MKAGRRDAVVGAALAVAAAAYLLPLRDHGLAINDDGWYLHPVLRMLQGEVLYRDVWTFYAPLPHHLFAALFRLAEPSILLARTVWIAMLVASAVGVHRIALRITTPAIAWIPAAVYALAPGPWYKAPFCLCTVAFFLALVRALEQPSRRRFLLLGALAGFALVTRQDLGLAQLGIAVVAAVLWAWLPERFGAAQERRHGTVEALLVVVAAGLVTLPVVAWYASQGALGPMLEATFVRAFTQMRAHPSGLYMLLYLEPFGVTREGRVAGSILLLPLFLYPAAALLLLVRLLRDGIGRETVGIGALLAYAAATLPQAWQPLLLIRFLQSAVPCYLLAAWLAGALARPLARRRGALARGASALTTLAFAAGGAFIVWAAIAGTPKVVPSAIYTGSARVLGEQQPVAVLGDEVKVGFNLADEIRLVRAFVGANVPPGDPVFVAPLHSLYYVLLGRRSPTRMLGEHPWPGDFVMTAEEKRSEMQRMLEAGTRFVVVDRSWMISPVVQDDVRRILAEEFHPVREYRSMLVLEREHDTANVLFYGTLRRLDAGTSGPEDAEALSQLVAIRPSDPLPHVLYGRALVRQGREAEAIPVFRRASELDPADPRGFEMAARLALELGRPDEAARDLARAVAVRPSPASDVLIDALPPRLRPPGAARSGAREDE